MYTRPTGRRGRRTAGSSSSACQSRPGPVFDELNADGPRQPATAKSADEVRQIHLGYVPIGGKYVGRRSPRAGEMIRFLGRRDFNDPNPAAQIRALRGIAADLASPSWGQLGDASPPTSTWSRRPSG